MTTIRPDGSVEFRFYRAGASAVSIAGDFTGWHEGHLPMQREGDGWWALCVALAGGEHRFRYIADGVWYTDFASHGVELAQKTWNSVLFVPETTGTRDTEQDRLAA